MASIEMKKKQIVIYIRDHLAMGGIEAYVFKQAKRLKESGAQIIWVKHPRAKIDSSFEPVFFDGHTILWNKKIKTAKIKELVRDGNAEIRIVTFDMYTYAKAEMFKRSFRDCPVHIFYFVPHFTGDTLYLEEAYIGDKREQIRKRLVPIVTNMQQNHNIYYFSAKHIEKMTQTYQYQIEDTESYLVPDRKLGSGIFDEKRCRELAARERFNLLTVSRFEFPHKGYVLGLIAAYAQLKEKYPHLELTIVGYGNDLARVENAIAALGDTARRDVHLVGKVPPDELRTYYDDANLNISVAGCCVQGAENGTLSIPARHYDYNCEVYGFFPESRPYTVSELPGEPVIPYIEQVINMSAEEYCIRCKRTFDAVRPETAAAIPVLEDLTNVCPHSVLSGNDVSFLIREEMIRVIRCKMRAVVREAKKLMCKLSGR